MQMADVLLILRRRIGDTDDPYTYDDDLLAGYIEDAVAHVEMDWVRGYDVEYGLFNNEPSKQDATIFCIKAHYLIELRNKDQANRNNFRMVKGRLTLDNTNQARDMKDSLDMIDKEYKFALYRAKNGGSITGVRLE